MRYKMRYNEDPQVLPGAIMLRFGLNNKPDVRDKRFFDPHSARTGEKLCIVKMWTTRERTPDTGVMMNTGDGPKIYTSVASLQPVVV